MCTHKHYRVLLLDLSQDTSASVIYLRGSCQTEEEKKSSATEKKERSSFLVFFFNTSGARAAGCWRPSVAFLLGLYSWFLHIRKRLEAHIFFSFFFFFLFLECVFFFHSRLPQLLAATGWERNSLSISLSVQFSQNLYFFFCACVCVFFIKNFSWRLRSFFFLWYLACSFNYVLLLYLLVCEVNTDDERKKREVRLWVARRASMHCGISRTKNSSEGLCVFLSTFISILSLLLSFSDDIHLNSIPPLAAAAVIRGVDRCCSARRPELRATMERRHYSSFGVFGTVTNWILWTRPDSFLSPSKIRQMHKKKNGNMFRFKSRLSRKPTW